MGVKEEALTDQRLEDLERFRDVQFPAWQKDLEQRFAEAFPGGDHRGHCRYHTIMIEQLEERRRLRRAVLEKSISGLVWAGMVFVGLAAWAYIKSQVSAS